MSNEVAVQRAVIAELDNMLDRHFETVYLSADRDKVIVNHEFKIFFCIVDGELRLIVDYVFENQPIVVLPPLGDPDFFEKVVPIALAAMSSDKALHPKLVPFTRETK